MTHFTLPSGVFRCGLPTFDPDFGLDLPEGDLGPLRRKVVEQADNLLGKYGIGPIQPDELVAHPNYIASEVGDDEELASDSKALIGIQMAFHRLYGMKVSEEDTSVSSRFGNFAEDLVILPDGYGQTYLSARKTGGWLGMSYVDVPKLRLAIDVRPMRMDHSATNDGKANMIGSRQRWIPLQAGWRGQYEVFNLFQDVNLGLIRDRKFPYLPSSLGGYGKEPPFRNYGNFERFLHAFKQGTHSHLVREVVRRTNKYLLSIKEKKDPVKDPLLSHVVRFQSSFHDWIKGRSIYAPVTWYDVPPEVGKYRAAKRGDSPVIDEVISRLIAERRLITESQLEIAVEHNELCKALLKAETIPEFKRIRDLARSSFHNFSIFSLENYGMIKEIILDKSLEYKDLMDEEVKLFFNLTDKVKGNLRVYLGEEYVYWPEAMDMIYERGPMKVHFLFNPMKKFSGHRGFAAPSSDYKSDMEDTEDLHGLDNLENWLRKESPRGSPPRVIINDDEPIIASCRKSQYNIIVTDDIRLCLEANSRTQQVVFRCPTEWYYLSVYMGEQSVQEWLGLKFPGLDWVEHIDSGSVKSFEENNFFNGAMLSRPKVQKFNFCKKISEKDPEIIEERVDFSYTPELVKLLFDRANILRLRKKGYRPRGRYSSYRDDNKAPLQKGESSFTTG